MPNNISWFAINADDVARARRFYEQVFAWKFEPWGPPDFYLIQTSDEKTRLAGGLQHRRELIRGARTVAYECTISVENIDQTIRAVELAGGTLAMPKFHIPTVGTGAYFIDTEGNVAGAMQQEK